jgi:uroporphyrinogen decarboxylase
VTPKERAVAALELRQPDDIVPTFELEFQLCQELFGTDFVSTHNLQGAELDRAVAHNAELHLRVAETLDYSIIRTGDIRVLRRLAKDGAGKRYLLCGEADGTMSIPSGQNMVEVSARLFEHPDEVKEELSKSAEWAIQWGREQIEAGAECLTMCADYCFNDGPFLSPKMFAEFVTPYLHKVVQAHRANGAYVIKHTDGDIMPIIDQLVSAGPHALHSIDPQAGVDLAEVKRLYGRQVCLCGNVNCGLLQTGTDEDVRRDAIRSITDGKPGGGYIFCTSNVAFKGMELRRYLMLLEIRREYGRYDVYPPEPPMWV